MLSKRDIKLFLRDIKLLEQVNYVVQTRYYVNLIMLFEQDDKLCKQDIKSFEQHNKLSEKVKK